MTILAIDTTGEHASFVVAHNTTVLAERTIDSRDGYGQVMFGIIEDLLKSAGCTIGDIDIYASASGPGSFTGVRVGLAAVKGLAAATGKPCFGISNLRALSTFGTAPLRTVLIDARRGDVFAAVYDSTGGLIVEETVTKAAAFLDALPPGDRDFICAPQFAPPGARVIEPPPYIAKAIAACAYADAQNGNAGDPASIDANYVRRSDAELYWTDKTQP